MKKEKGIPTIIGLIILILSLVAGLFLSSKKISFNTKASSSCKPINPQVTNITNNSFDVSFTTSLSCSSSIVVNNLTIPFASSSNLHYFSITNLKENTDYSFSFIINGENYEDSSYLAHTAQKPSSSIPTSNLAWGKVFNPDNTPAAGSIVYLSIPGAAPLSSLVTSSGNWNVSLAISFNEAKNNWFVPEDNVEEYIIVISKDGQATQVVGNTSHNNPVGDIIIGQNRLTEEDTGLGNQAAEALLEVTPIIVTQKLEIDNPKDGENIFSLQPQFFGKGPTNQKIIIKVESPETYTGESVVQEDGSWNWSVPENLTPGEHTVTVSTQNSQTGLWETITRKFVVLASSSELSFSASSSAQITPTSVPTDLPPSPTPTETPVPSPTSTPIVRVAHPATDSGVPTTGNFFPTILLIIIAIFLISGSIFLNKKNAA